MQDLFSDTPIQMPAGDPQNIPGVFRFDRNYFQAGPDGTEGNECIEVFLDGVRLPSCTQAHAGMGWATSYLVGEDGRVIHDGLGRAKFQTLRGRVELRRCN